MERTMITRRPADARGTANFGWLDSRHSFSFGQYYDPDHMGFSDLRVINEDRVAGGGGFDRHPHRDMEILTFVLAGALEHQDTLGNRAVIGPGELQRMSAGRGIQHAEYNHSQSEPVHFLQIWLLPEQPGLEPSYEQEAFDPAATGLTLIGAREGGEGVVTIHQDVALYRGHLDAGQTVEHALRRGRRAWLQVTGGRLEVNGTLLEAGDGAAVADEAMLAIVAQAPAEFLLFDLR
jgi:hypothetical protein